MNAKETIARAIRLTTDPRPLTDPDDLEFAVFHAERLKLIRENRYAHDHTDDWLTSRLFELDQKCDDLYHNLIVREKDRVGR